VPATTREDGAVPALGVVVPAGGRGRRLDGDKLSADVTGVALLDRTLDGLPADAVVVCVGPTRATRRDVAWTRETPAAGGPLAAVAAGVDALPPDVTVVLLVGGDMPDAGRAVDALLDSLDTEVGPNPGRTAPRCSAVTDRGGRRQPLLTAWRRDDLERRLTALSPTHGRALAALLDEVVVTDVPDSWAASRDVDTPADLAAARERFEQPLP
jgi:CTP:molybdopterin cytidylyltransferase MocA